MLVTRVQFSKALTIVGSTWSNYTYFNRMDYCVFMLVGDLRGKQLVNGIFFLNRTIRKSNPGMFKENPKRNNNNPNTM